MGRTGRLNVRAAYYQRRAACGSTPDRHSDFDRINRENTLKGFVSRRSLNGNIDRPRCRSHSHDGEARDVDLGAAISSVARSGAGPENQPNDVTCHKPLRSDEGSMCPAVLPPELLPQLSAPFQARAHSAQLRSRIPITFGRTFRPSLLEHRCRRKEGW